MPRLKSETISSGDQSWLATTHGIRNCRTATIDVALFTAGTKGQPGMGSQPPPAMGDPSELPTIPPPPDGPKV